MSEPRYRLIVFDWDGTLMDSTQRIVNSFRAAARDCAVGPPDDGAIREIIGLGLPEALARLFPRCDAGQRADIRRHYREHFLDRDVAATPLFPGVRQGLAQLRAEGYQLAVATGKTRLGLDRAMADSGIGGMFGCSRCADESPSKPDPAMLLAILEASGTAADQALMVGDTVYDLEMAGHAGVDAVGVSYGAHDGARLRTAGARGVADTFAGFRQWLR